MALAMMLTAIYHYLLLEAFDPLLVFTPTSTKDIFVKDAVQPPSFQHEALRSVPLINIPQDKFGIADQIKMDLDGVAVVDDVATIDLYGKIEVRSGVSQNSNTC
jgi:hypothetical protein